MPSSGDIFGVLIVGIVIIGSIPEVMLQITFVPRGERNETLRVAASKRPISLVCAMAQILGATRFKVLTGNGAYRTKCPKQTCFEKDSFQHMLRCYEPRESLSVGAQVAPFLVRMAGKALLEGHHRILPYPEEATAESWMRERV